MREYDEAHGIAHGIAHVEPLRPEDPSPHDTFGIEERCRSEWASSPALRAEFSCLEAYVAFRRAEAKGLVRIINRPK